MKKNCASSWLFTKIYEEDNPQTDTTYGHGSTDVMLQIGSAFAITDEVGWDQSRYCIMSLGLNFREVGLLVCCESGTGRNGPEVVSCSGISYWQFWLPVFGTRNIYLFIVISCVPGLSLPATRLRAGRPGARIPAGARDLFHQVLGPTQPRVQWALVLSPGGRGGVFFPAHLRLAPRLTASGAIPHFPLNL
jgi:hypothetical protein